MTTPGNGAPAETGEFPAEAEAALAHETLESGAADAVVPEGTGLGIEPAVGPREGGSHDRTSDGEPADQVIATVVPAAADLPDGTESDRLEFDETDVSTDGKLKAVAALGGVDEERAASDASEATPEESPVLPEVTPAPKSAYETGLETYETLNPAQRAFAVALAVAMDNDNETDNYFAYLDDVLPEVDRDDFETVSDDDFTTDLETLSALLAKLAKGDQFDAEEKADWKRLSETIDDETPATVTALHAAAGILWSEFGFYFDLIPELQQEGVIETEEGAGREDDDSPETLHDLITAAATKLMTEAGKLEAYQAAQAALRAHHESFDPAAMPVPRTEEDTSASHGATHDQLVQAVIEISAPFYTAARDHLMVLADYVHNLSNMTARN